MRFITRMDYQRAKGWNVRFNARGLEPFSKLFSDALYGGKAGALVAAKAWRDCILRAGGALVGVSTTGASFHHRTRNNQTGVVGVIAMVERRGTPRVAGWRATWQQNGQTKRVTYSVVQHGYEEAYRLAVAHRCRILGLEPPVLKVPAELDFL